MRTIALFAVIATAILVGLGVRVYLKRFELSTLSSAQLLPRQGTAHPPVVEDCSSLRRVYQSLVNPQRMEVARGVAALSDDEISIYRMVIQKWVAGDNAPLKIAAQTYPLELFADFWSIECECLSGFEAENLAAVSHSFHNLNRTVLPRKTMRLVDNSDAPESPSRDDASGSHRTPGKIAFADVANGVFSLSEVAFDRDHLHALVSYSFQCGMLCGSGRTILLEKVNGQWQKTKTECGGWES